MDLRTRSLIFAEGNFEIFENLANTVLSQADVKVVKEPQTCLVMMSALDSVEQVPFYLGEVLITEAAVELDGMLGYGFALENQPVKALCFAVLEAALQAGHDAAPIILEAFQNQAAVVEEKRRQEGARLAGTRVNFDVMEG